MIVVEGCEIAVREDGREDPPIVLVHGGGAHAHWWDRVLDHLGDRRVVRCDLSGHGESGYRAEYRPWQWAEEIAAVAALAGPGVHVAGHSMGGRMAALAAARHPEAIGRLTLIDSALPLLPRDVGMPRVRPRRLSPSRAEAEARFRLMPPEPADPADVAHLAPLSVVERADGWDFRWDPRIFEHLLDQAPEDALPDVRCPIQVIDGAESTITSAHMTAELQAGLGREVPVTVVPGAHHHVILSHAAEVAAWLAG